MVSHNGAGQFQELLSDGSIAGSCGRGSDLFHERRQTVGTTESRRKVRGGKEIGSDPVPPRPSWTAGAYACSPVGQQLRMDQTGVQS